MESQVSKVIVICIIIQFLTLMYQILKPLTFGRQQDQIKQEERELKFIPKKKIQLQQIMEGNKQVFEMDTPMKKIQTQQSQSTPYFEAKSGDKNQKQIILTNDQMKVQEGTERQFAKPNFKPYIQEISPTIMINSDLNKEQSQTNITSHRQTKLKKDQKKKYIQMKKHQYDEGDERFQQLYLETNKGKQDDLTESNGQPQMKAELGPLDISFSNNTQMVDNPQNQIYSMQIPVITVNTDEIIQEQSNQQDIPMQIQLRKFSPPKNNTNENFIKFNSDFNQKTEEVPMEKQNHEETQEQQPPPRRLKKVISSSRFQEQTDAISDEIVEKPQSQPFSINFQEQQPVDREKLKTGLFKATDSVQNSLFSKIGVPQEKQEVKETQAKETTSLFKLNQNVEQNGSSLFKNLITQINKSIEKKENAPVSTFTGFTLFAQKPNTIQSDVMQVGTASPQNLFQISNSGNLFANFMQPKQNQ